MGTLGTQVVLSAAVWGMNFALPASGSEGKDLMATDSWTDTRWLNLGSFGKTSLVHFWLVFAKNVLARQTR